MDSRSFDARRLGFASLLLAACQPGESDDEAGETTDPSTGDETSDETGDSGTGTDETGSEGLQACGEVPGGNLAGPPRLVSARLDGDALVRLTFTEPLASVAEIDPASFRISWPFYEGGYGGEPGYTAYYDPMALLCSATDYCTGVYTEVVELGCAADDPAALLLRLEGFATDVICNLIAYDPSAQLLPHFDASIGPIVDLDGEPLASIAAHWVQVPEVYTEVDGEYPDYPLRIPIECPE
ncbi:hypothetical protein ACNOYE_23080 [Nannocystaceae bacterium ST9]